MSIRGADMLKPLVLVSGWVEVVFGASAILFPAMVMKAIGETGPDALVIAIVRVLGGATMGLGAGALVARNHLDTQGGLAAAYGLALYNIVAAVVLFVAAVQLWTAGLWAGAVLHVPIAILFVVALKGRL